VSVDESAGGEAGHREIDHTADLGFEVWAPSVEGLFAAAVVALAELCYDRERVVATDERPLRVAGETPEERLVHWLQEVYYWLERDLWLASAAERVEVEGDTVRGVVRGEAYDPLRHTLHTEIKAITYHQLGLRFEDGLWRTTVIVDV
jgi:SHS2 domain-containing protein